jgi:hypothetical protein
MAALTVKIEVKMDILVLIYITTFNKSFSINIKSHMTKYYVVVSETCKPSPRPAASSLKKWEQKGHGTLSSLKGP